ncbi:hypothetical protein J1614_005458 [Plenodomus biglobosus]|nr:hypothetical protein J1614_005458 [Plenodomus biglobosus]
MSARTDLAMAIDESTPHHSVDNTSTPTIGYVCDKEDSGYVFKCGNCACSDKSYGRWADLKRHYEGAHAGVRRATYWCEVQGCDRSQAYGDQPFRRKDHLTLHVRKVHPDPKRIFPGLEFDICVSGDAGSWAC